MKLELEFFGCLCSCKTFIINDVDADHTDFGEKCDESPEDEYGCGNMVFKSKDCTLEILQKYNITEAEYMLIAQQLTDGLSFGSCGYCA